MVGRRIPFNNDDGADNDKTILPSQQVNKKRQERARRTESISRNYQIPTQSLPQQSLRPQPNRVRTAPGPTPALTTRQRSSGWAPSMSRIFTLPTHFSIHVRYSHDGARPSNGPQQNGHVNILTLWDHYLHHPHIESTLRWAGRRRQYRISNHPIIVNTMTMAPGPAMALTKRPC